jgi:hypothetical protein
MFRAVSTATLLVAAVAFRLTPCPVDTKTNVFGLNSAAADLYEEGELELAHGCFAVVINRTEAGSQLHEAAWSNMMATQAIMLKRTVAKDADFISLWTSLTEALKQRNRLTVAELNRVTTPFDAYLLHAQFECEADRVHSAIRSYTLALKEAPQNDAGVSSYAIFRDLARIAIGRGLPIDAVKLLRKADELPYEPLSAEAATGLMLQLQAAAFAAAVPEQPASGDAAADSDATLVLKALKTAWAKAAAYADRLIDGSVAGSGGKEAAAKKEGKKAKKAKAPPVPPFFSILSPRTTAAAVASADVEPSGDIAVSTASDLLSAGAVDAASAASLSSSGFVHLRSVLPARLLAALQSRHGSLFAGAASSAAPNSLLDPPAVSYNATARCATAHDDALAQWIALHLTPVVASAVEARVVSAHTLSVACGDSGSIAPHPDVLRDGLLLLVNAAAAPSWPLLVSPAAGGLDQTVIIGENDALMFQGATRVRAQRPATEKEGESAFHGVVLGFREVNPDTCHAQ